MRSSLFIAASAVAASTILAACGGGGGGPASSSSPPPSAVTISVRGVAGSQSFSPNPAQAAGQSTVFRNDDVIVHRVLLNDGSIDTGDIAPGASSRAVMMPAAGTNYHCSLHPTMIGSVNAAGQLPPPCVGIYCD
jgi:plastocyanin